MSTELNAAQQGLVDCYRQLAGIISESREELAPFEERNALKALAALWQVMNGLDQSPGHAYHVGA